MEELVRQLSTSDTKKKLAVGQKLIDFLGDPESVVECEEMGTLVDSLVPWMQSSNFKVRPISKHLLSSSTMNVLNASHSMHVSALPMDGL